MVTEVIVEWNEPSPWAAARFGALATEMSRAVARAVSTAHHDAVAAHIAGNMKSNDTYGNTMLVRMNEELVALALPGDDEMREESMTGSSGLIAIKPEEVRSRFRLLIVEDSNVAVYPWRFGDSPKVRHEDAKLRRPVSDLRAATFSLSATAGTVQPTLMDVDAPIEELESQWAQEADLRDELVRLGAVVVVAVSSSPDGIFELGWGDVELVDRETGDVIWHHWEVLPVATAADVVVQRAVLRDVAAARPRFGDVPFDDELGLSPRRDETPSADAPALQLDTGTTADGDDQ
ncbi:hypothetical protein ASE38_01710 [Cellulomonas sp. Root930]|nr:hypothetical protein ASE38_01710 [Cellulomonas sp. Root930]